jgi:hypothetical protein
MNRRKGKCRICGRSITVKLGVGPSRVNGRGDLMWHKLRGTKDWCPGSDEKPIEDHEASELEDLIKKERPRG